MTCRPTLCAHAPHPGYSLFVVGNYWSPDVKADTLSEAQNAARELSLRHTMNDFGVYQRGVQTAIGKWKNGKYTDNTAAFVSAAFDRSGIIVAE